MPDTGRRLRSDVELFEWVDQPSRFMQRAMKAKSVGLRFGMLGPLEVFDGGRPLQITRKKDRLLLAALLTNANQVVSTDQLLDVLWGDSPPSSGLKALQFHVSALRDVLNPERIGTVDTCLKTRSRGYVLGLVWDGSGATLGSPSWYDEATETIWVTSSGKVLQIPVHPDRWVERACEIVGRDLTQEEWDCLVPGDETLQSACGQIADQ